LKDVQDKGSVCFREKDQHVKRPREGLGMVAHLYNPSYMQCKDRRIVVEGLPGQKVSETCISTNKLDLVVHTMILAMLKA
jgi:hypothetical protein